MDNNIYRGFGKKCLSLNVNISGNINHNENIFTVPQSAQTEVSDEVLWMTIALIGAEINAFKVRTDFRGFVNSVI